MGDELFDLLAPTVGSFDLELLDLEVRPGLVRLVVDGPGGAQLDAIAAATQAVSHVLDAHDPQPGRRYTLEVTSPGVERPLRTPGQFARAVGETVTIRTASGEEGTRRHTGRLTEADDEGFVLELVPDEGDGRNRGEGQSAGEGTRSRRFAYSEIERARTVFQWGTSGRPGSGGRSGRRTAGGPGTGGGQGTDRKRVTTP